MIACVIMAIFAIIFVVSLLFLLLDILANFYRAIGQIDEIHKHLGLDKEDK